MDLSLITPADVTGADEVHSASAAYTILGIGRVMRLEFTRRKVHSQQEVDVYEATPSANLVPGTSLAELVEMEVLHVGSRIRHAIEGTPVRVSSRSIPTVRHFSQILGWAPHQS